MGKKVIDVLADYFGGTVEREKGHLPRLVIRESVDEIRARVATERLAGMVEHLSKKS